MPSMIGTPPNCRRECTINSECDLSKACKNFKCVDPCGSNVCGINAYCNVVSHSPLCNCNNGYTGNAFIECKPPFNDVLDQDPCKSSPCGPNSQCRDISGIPVCTCLEGFIGSPPNCKYECIVHSDCPNSLACGNNRKCVDPCINACGINARYAKIFTNFHSCIPKILSLIHFVRCVVNNHNPVCTCDTGFRGDPFYSCEREPGKYSKNIP